MDTLNIYKHCIECLRFAYNVIGYENCMKEINFIHHLNDKQLSEINDIKSPTQEPVKIHQEPVKIHQEPVNIIEINNTCNSNTQDTSSENKNIIVETPIKYYRPALTDNIRCTKILETGIRCSFRKDTNSELCSRHNKS
jgi:hypothetical protein